MPHAVTHILIVIILLELYRDYFVKNKKTFPLHYVLIGGIAGILPDVDVVVYWILYYGGFAYEQIHRTFTHTLLFPLFFVLLSIPFFNFKNKSLEERHLKLRNIFLVIAFGVLIHLILDAFIAGTVMPFYPISTASIGYNLINLFPQALRFTIEPALDGLIFILWLVYIETRHKISSFI